MEIGKKIKTLRLGKGLTQENLAAKLGVTPQAVSRWENGSSMPDIMLLPSLSVLFGVRVDDFFELSDEAQLERIDNMMEQEEFLSREDFDHAQRYLKDRLAADPKDVRCCRALAELYNHRADGYHRKAEVLAKRAIELSPTEKAGHSILSFAANGCCWDWCSGNHRELIEYYYDFVKSNPGYQKGYLWLMDNLIADGRLDEALEAAEAMKCVEYTYHVPLYKGHIAFLMGNKDEAERHWTDMVNENPENWIVWSCMGDACAKQGRWDDAAAYFEKAATMETAPRYIDNWDSIGQIREIQKRWEDAANAYEKVLEVYREDYRLTEGYWVDKYRSAVLKCRANA